jgi:predicted permease
MRDFARDLRYAARRLAATPVFTLFAVLSLAVGIGVTTVAYSVVDNLLVMKPAPGIRQPASLAVLVSAQRGRAYATAADLEAIRRGTTTLDDVAGQVVVDAPLVGAARTEPVSIAATTETFFHTLGMVPLRGRLLGPADERQAAPVVVLSALTWQHAFNSAPDIVGRTIRLAEHPFEVVGVAPEGFTNLLVATPARGIGAWIPLSSLRSVEPQAAAGRGPANVRIPLTDDDHPHLEVVGRLRPGRTAAMAAADLARIAASLDRTAPRITGLGPNSRTERRAWRAQRLTDPPQGGDDRLFYVVATMVILIVVVACTNLANMVLARGVGRRQDLAVRRALGASRWRLVREQLAEAVLITAGGGIASLLVMRLVARLATHDIRLDTTLLRIEPGIDARTLWMTTLALLVSLIVIGLEPAWQLTRTEDLRGTLAHEAGGAGLPRARRHRFLLRWQVCVATTYFILAAMTIRVVVAEVGHRSGIQLDGLAVAQIEPPAREWDARREHAFIERVAGEMADGSRVRSAAFAARLPFSGFRTSPVISLSTPSAPFLDQRDYPTGVVVPATPGILDALGVPLLTGRRFEARDDAAGATVAIVSRATALRLFGTADAVGRQLLYGYRAGANRNIVTTTIVGVAGDTEERYLSDHAALVLYVPLAQSMEPARYAVARAPAEADAERDLQQAIRRADPDVMLLGIGAASQVMTGPYPLARYFSRASVLLGLVTLTLAMAGLFGIQADGVARRTREFGVRMSFGATAGQVKRMVLRDGSRPVIDGMILGLVMGMVGRLIVRAYLFDGQMDLLDPWLLVAVPIPVLLAGFCACYLPARRASRVQPIVALRHL